MLDMANDRLDYLELLRPPKDHRLEYAVGTTYSLDLGALLGACMSLAGIDSETDPRCANRVALFSALETVQDRIALYCEKGHIKNDAGFGRLSILLERMIHQVVVKKPSGGKSDGTASFHPKVWIVDYRSVKTKKHLYRLLILSRNLTFDGSWDVVACLEGYDDGKTVTESESIAAFLDYLRQRRGIDNDKGNREEMRKLIKRISSVRFEVDANYFDNFEFMPFVPADSTKNDRLLNSAKTSLLSLGFDKVLIVSPFLGNRGPVEIFIQNWEETKKQSGEFYLISRQRALDELSPSIRNRYHCYTPQNWLADVDLEQNAFDMETDTIVATDTDKAIKQTTSPVIDTNEVDESLASQYSDLHAKMYFTEGAGGRNLYLGSLNASYNGIQNNVEVLVRFHVKPYKLTFNEFRDSLIGGKNPPFGQYRSSNQPILDADENEIAFDKRFHAAAKVIEFEKAKVCATESCGYSLFVRLKISWKSPEEGERYSIAPFLANSKAFDLQINEDLIWEQLEASQLSQFFVLYATSPSGLFRSCIIKCPNNLFDDSVLDHASRVQDLFDHILSEWNDALSTYVDIAFGINPGFRGEERGSRGLPTEERRSSQIGSGLYEQLMDSLADYDGALDRLKYARHMIGLIPPNHEEDRVQAMRDLLDTFEAAVRKMGRHHG